MRLGAGLIIPLALTACVARTTGPPTSDKVLMLGDIALSPVAIISAELGFSANGQPLVNVRLSPAGAVQLEAVTRSFLGREMPIRIGNEILFNPRVLEPISGGEFQISGLMTAEEAQKIARRIAGR